jgi:replication initiation protein RepC
LRGDLGISKPLWGDARLATGRELAAVALAVVSTKDPVAIQPRQGAGFHGMVAKARGGELHLDRTVWTLQLAGQPDFGRRASRSRV